MNYFLKTLRENTKKFWMFTAWFVAGCFALVDILATAFGGSIFGGKLFSGFIIVNIAGVIALIIYKAVSQSKKKVLAREVEKEAAFFEPKQEEEIRKKIAENPEFMTLCYKCIHYNQNKLHCSRDMEDERLKQVRINDRKYCLYWVEVPQPGA